MVGLSLSNHPTDQHEIPPTVVSIAPDLEQPQVAALDTGYFNAWCEFSYTVLHQNALDANAALPDRTNHGSADGVPMRLRRSHTKRFSAANVA